MKYRIKQYSQNEYVAEIKKDLFSSWEALDIQYPAYTWTIKDYVKKHAMVISFEEAEKVIERRKEWNEAKKQYPKIYNVK